MKKATHRPPTTAGKPEQAVPADDAHGREAEPRLESLGQDDGAPDAGNPQAHADGSVSIVREGSGRAKRM